MSIIDTIGDALTGGLLYAAGKYKSNMMNDAAIKAASEQAKMYKNSTDMANKAAGELKTQQDNERRRIQEKQIRGLRNSYRPVGGFLSSQGNVPSSPNNLGSTSGLPSKLGNA